MNKKIFHEQVLPMQDPCFRFAFRMLANREEAEDIVQDMLLKIWQKQDDLHKVKNVSGWTMQMVKNACLDKLKSSAYKYRDDNAEASLSRLSIAEDKSEQQEKWVWIEKGIDRLPPRQKMIFQLREIEGYSYEEIATILEIELSGVKVSLFRARKSIKSFIDKIENYERRAL